MILIEDVMTPNPVTLTRYNSLADARRIMKERRFRHIPIVNEFDQVIGIVSHRNVLQHGLTSQSFLEEHELAEIENGTLIADIMISPVTTISPTCTIKRAAEMVHKYKYGCLPVVNSDRKLVGIVTDHDFVAISIHLLEMLEDSEPLNLED